MQRADRERGVETVRVVEVLERPAAKPGLVGRRRVEAEHLIALAREPSRAAPVAAADVQDAGRGRRQPPVRERPELVVQMGVRQTGAPVSPRRRARSRACATTSATSSTTPSRISTRPATTVVSTIGPLAA